MDAKTMITGAIGLTKVALHIDRAEDRLVNCRRTICENCQYKQRILKEVCGKEIRVARCEKCKCFINAKTLIAGESCPIGLW